MTSFRKLEKVRRDAQRQAERDQAQLCIVLYNDSLYIRRPSRARNLSRKHPGEAIILATVDPRGQAA
jgi:hypothetical protein